MALSSNARKSIALAAVASIGAGVALSGSLPSFEGRSAAPTGSPARPSPPPAAGSAELALVAPIAPGARFEGWMVRRVSSVHAGAIRIELERGSERAALTIHAAKGGPSPPATAGPYAVYYSSRDPAEGERLSRALAAVLFQHRDRPVPAGLDGFREETRKQ